ncbi:hypothetical protein B0T11DRAFT_324550 [Plectosphaerella cucumerina]|uniref:Uncharacterized protein n=1 Tax=Plectosphaerella cucumerina TaxID=40658 RepID=A0A8K0X998_9PEZI|nr:hypothetical protein B0T11DRAFT_324550 [Plectosphaerella cucumerina]
MTNISRSLLPFCLASALIKCALAQGSSNSSTYNCPRALRSVAEGRASFNSTGTAPLRLGYEEQFYLTYALEDQRADNLWFGEDVTGQYLGVYLSVPESFIGTRHANNTRFCMYMMPGRNATSDDSEDDPASCAGILSDECYDAMLNATLRAMPERDNCPPMEGLREHCGFGTHVGRGAPSNFSDPTCTVDGLPGVDLPDGYRTYAGFTGTHILPPDPARDSFEVYDLRVRQPVPMLITNVREGGQGDMAIMCLAPSNVTEGSREPEGDFPPPAALSSTYRGSLALGVVMAGLTGCILS